MKSLESGRNVRLGMLLLHNFYNYMHVSFACACVCKGIYYATHYF